MKLILMMVKVLMKVILVLLFISDFRHGVVALRNAEHIKKISKELILQRSYPKRWSYWCLSEDEKKKIHLIFTDKVGKC